MRKNITAVAHLIKPPQPQPMPIEMVGDPLSRRSVLEQVVLSTSGQQHIGQSMVADFKRLFADFIRSYVLYFQPFGVSGTGWHDVAVKVTRKGGYTVHARRGYFAGSGE